MKKLLRSLAALALSGSGLLAQNLDATWQGTLQVGQRSLRLVFKISLADDKLKATMYSIDQPAPPIPVTTVTRDGSSLKMTIAAAGATFEGKLNPDGNSISGTWSQGAPIPLTLARATPQTAWAIPDPPAPVRKMAADAKPEFEVATIKPAHQGDPFAFVLNPSAILNASNNSLNDLIKFGYNLHARQISGGPPWLDSDRFSITAKPDTPGMPSIAQLRMMLQKLLADRFQLKFHMEKRALSVYAITLVKGGPKMAKDEVNTTGLPGFGGGGRGNFRAQNATMKEFAEFLQGQVLDRPVVDQTELGATRYDFGLRWMPDAGTQLGGPGAAGVPPVAAENPDSLPDFFQAMQQQLGLKIEATKAEVDVLVIDKAEKPSGN
jgi:uncharacterized protein (TIGR03435 family)